MNESNENINNKKKLTMEQLQQLIALQQNTQQENAPKKRITMQQALAYIFQKMQTLQRHLDRFVNFISKPEDKDRNDVVQAARAPILFGLYVTIFFVGFGGLWSILAPLNSAVIATGTVVSSTNKKVIQHLEGGIIKNIYVKPGDHVKKDDKLIELEDAQTKAKYENIVNQYRISLANESRLIAERDNLETIEFPPFLKENINIPEVEKIIHTQENIFRYERETFRAEKESLKQKIQQLNKQVEGFEARKVAAQKNLAIYQDRLTALTTLKEKGMASKSAVLELEAKVANFKSEIAMAETEIAKTFQDITRAEIENMNLENKFISQILNDLKKAQSETAAYKEQHIALTEAMQRIIIKSPVDGVINTLNKHTIGGVVGHGEQLIEISPSNDSLVIEAKVPHKNIDSVHIGLIAKIRFSAFKSRTTPLFTGKIVLISPDIIQEKTPGMDPKEATYYSARIEIDMDEFQKIAKAKKLELHPGMQAEIQIITGTRTLFRYLLDPVTDTVFKAFREK